MFAILIAILLLAIAVGTIYLILKNMGEEGIEVAAPGSCKSGRCGVRCAPEITENDEETAVLPDEADDARQKGVA